MGRNDAKNATNAAGSTQWGPTWNAHKSASRIAAMRKINLSADPFMTVPS